MEFLRVDRQSFHTGSMSFDSFALASSVLRMNLLIYLIYPIYKDAHSPYAF